ncbi:MULTISPECIES: restriction endonuclease subunit S [Raoultella]|uniref:restriction endonuclease subunit S n=1 Tax=Raoultella TaxID=160674 RepID=UPI0022515277|nr:restriction endonuclease subunit S [Raoultella sp. DY2415]EKW7682846.1 restriction endonuclease subunit S [Raoultella ornithinolytica]ELN4412977.1 restriction endonuclease subunit S [Raoultella ornithinolytica]HEC2600300.1 restriction endonuclease subunit S [Raoultella ornithinolytica]HEC2600997.1 restriction endonuclease subunit S [Raoultella ornithinolytica]
MAVEKLIVDHIDTWTTALQTRSTAGRGSSGKIDLYGIKKLRELILELAVRGKLVPQDPNDEPAAVLLERNEERKKELSRNEGMKTTASPHIHGNEYYIDAPENWSWIRLGNLAKFIDYRGKTPHKKENGIRLITAKNIRKGYIDLSPEEFIAEEDYTSWMTRGFPKCGDILFTTEAPLGNAAIIDVDGKFALAQRSICFQWHIPEISPFMLIQIMAMPFQSQLNDKSTGMTAAGIKASKLKEIPVILPPYQEQTRIVSRVQDLMSLCDQLEQHSLTSLDAHQQLVETLLTTLTNSQNADELAENWARISEHFDTLFTTEASIDALKQTILQLAVMGKLVQSTDVVEYKKLKTFLSFGPRNGFSPVESKNNTRFKVLKLGATSYGELNIQESKFVDIDIDNNSHLYIKEGDILIQRGNSANFVGCNVLVKENHKNIIYPDLMMKIRTNEDLLPEYASIWLSSPLARGFMWDRMTGTSGTMPKISKKVVEEIPIIVPSIATQQKCIAFVNLATKICSDLKTRLQTSQQTQLHLADALTDAAIN